MGVSGSVHVHGSLGGQQGLEDTGHRPGSVVRLHGPHSCVPKWNYCFTLLNLFLPVTELETTGSGIRPSSPGSGRCACWTTACQHLSLSRLFSASLSCVGSGDQVCQLQRGRLCRPVPAAHTRPCFPGLLWAQPATQLPRLQAVFLPFVSNAALHRLDEFLSPFAASHAR